VSKEWPIKPISTFAKTSAGGTPSKAKKEFYENGSIPWLLSGEVSNPNITEATNFITEAGLKGSSAKIFPKDSVLVAMYGATAGEVGILRIEAATNQAVCAILPSDRHVPKYLYYYLLHAKPSLVAQAVGNAQPNISQQKIKALAVPLPPLDEQRKIVAILDEAFEGIDRARANVEANAQDAYMLFTTSVEEIISPEANEWTTGPLSTMVGPVSTGPFGSLLHKSDYVENEIPLVNPANIINGKITPDLRKTVSRDTLKKLSSYVLEKDDIVVGRRGEMGRCAVVTADQAGWLCGTGSFFIRPNKNIAPKLVAYLLRSPSFVRKLELASTGATMANLSNRVLGELQISLPAQAIQERLLDQIAELEDKSFSLSRIMLEKLKALSNLRQSLLQKAFAGELT